MPNVTFIGPHGTTVVEAAPGETLLDVAERHDIMMGSACGGVCACSSCHCYVRQGLQTLPEMSDAENDRLDMGFDVRPYSRLGCQVKVGTTDLVVELTQESIRTWYDEHPQARKP
ncbi:2Fe-2S iron-sulfur cluster-binding protein [Nannocystis pusilla]|uniref:2Fe-2S iron-sulfur cluster-binding protein n=1 Tax=Nannocystis pusilla TaxID=889268 RepID=UPI003BF431D4